MGPTTVPPLDQGCKLIKFPSSDSDRHRRTLVRVASLAHLGLHQPTVHYDCAENQIRSLVGRVAGVVPHPTPDGLKLLRRAANILSRNIPPTTANELYDMPARYSGNKRARYQDACDAFTMSGITKRDAGVKMFVKPERFNPEAKRNPDPRAIQFRNGKYCVALAQYLHPIEHHIYEIDCASQGVPKSRNVAKGLNSCARAELMLAKSEHFDDPVYIMYDAARFDKHVALELLQIEHAVYLRSNPDAYFRILLSWQLVNLCFSNLGLVYRVRGRRMSGDMNTAVGNCILMLIMLIAIFTLILDIKWDCCDDGDDVVVIVERKDFCRVESVVAPTFLTFGMEIKVDQVCSDLHEVVFCQSSIIEYRPSKLKFVRDWRKVMSNALCGVRHWTSDTYRIRTMHAIGTCELVLNLGVPLLQEFAVAILRNAACTKPVDLTLASEGLQRRTLRDLKAMGVDPNHIQPQEIYPCARATFARAYGVSEEEQLRIEAQLRSWDFAVHGYELKPSEVLVETWELTPTTSEVYGQ